MAWLDDPPAVDAELRQGDLIVGIPFPAFGTVQISPEGLRGEVGPKDVTATAVVLDHCCTVEQKHVVLLARVTSRDVDPEFLAVLQNNDPTKNKPYSQYLHLLDPHVAMAAKKGKRKLINMLDRVQLAGSDPQAFAWLREARVARMDVVSRAHLRMRLMILFGRVERDSDEPLLKAQGLDSWGRPEPQVTDFPGELRG